MTNLTDSSKSHLREALRNDDPSEKDFHIRQVLQADGVDRDPDEAE